MVDAGGRRNRDGDGWVREDELQDELRPARRAEFGRPFGEWLILEPVGQRALPERPVDNHGNAALRRQRQQPLLRLAVDDVVGELHEIDRLVPHYLFEKIMAAPFGRRDSNVAHRTSRLHLEERLQMRLPGEEIVNLNEVEPWHAPEATRLLDLGRACRCRGRPDLFSRE